MAKLNSTVTKEARINAPIEEVYKLLSDFERSASYVPDLERAIKKDENLYRWEFKPIGIKGISIQVRYDVKFTTREPTEVSWETIPGSGNAEVKGKFTLKDAGGSTDATLSMDVTVDIPAPKLMMRVLKPFLDREIRDLVDGYLSNIKKALEEG